MADNTTIDPGLGGDVVRDVERAGVKTQVVALDLNPSGAEALVNGGTLPTADVTAQGSLASILAKLTADPATQTTLAAILTKLSADPATQTTVAAILAKLSADPSTGAKQDTQATKLDTLHTDLGLLLKPADVAALATAAKQDTGNTSLASIDGKLTSPLSVDSDSGGGKLAGDNRKTVTTPGTAVAIAASTACKWVTVTAFHSNTDKVAVGTSSVLAALGSQRGFILAPGQSASFAVANLSTVFVDSRVASEGVAFAYGT